jgi:hypothetical protein
MHVSLNNPQADFIELPHRFRAFVGGFGSGKTWVGCTAMGLRYYTHPRVDQAYYGPTYPHIRDIFYPTMEEVAHTLDLRVQIMESNKEVHFYSGRRYRGTTICRSMDRPASIIGYKVGHSAVDEFDTLPAEKAKLAWRKIIARHRWDGATNGADVLTTPEGFGETHRLFVQEVSQRPELAASYGMVQASTRENEANLPDGYIQSLLDTYPAELIEAYIEGRFCNLTSGTVYHKYNRLAHDSRETIRPNEPLFIGMDFNVGKMAATVYVQRENGWHAAHELHDLSDTPEMAARIRDTLQTQPDGMPKRRIVVYPDASGGSTSTKDASKSDIAILRSHGFEIRANSTNPAVRDRILSVNKQFEVGRLWVNSVSCPVTARCLEQQPYKNGEPDKKSGFDHQNDATGYPIAYEFPIVRPMTKLKMAGH